jgi:hypothetical protein
MEVMSQSEDNNKFMFERLSNIFYTLNEEFLDCDNLSVETFDGKININDFEYIIDQKNELNVYRYKDGNKVKLISYGLINSCFMGCHTWSLKKTWIEYYDNGNEIVVYTINLGSGHIEDPPSDFYQKTTFKFIDEYVIKSNTEVYSEENNKTNPYNEKGIYYRSIYNSKKYIDIIEKKYHATYNKTYAFRLNILERFFKEFYIKY